MHQKSKQKTFSSRLLSLVSGAPRSTKMSRSRVWRTKSAGVLGLDLNKPFILALSAPPSLPSGSGSLRATDCDAEARSDGWARSGARWPPLDKQPPILNVCFIPQVTPAIESTLSPVSIIGSCQTINWGS